MDHEIQDQISSSIQFNDRKTVEKNRRSHMKSLVSQLNSLIPRKRKNSKDGVQLSDQLGEAANYIEVLKRRIDELKEKRQDLIGQLSQIGECENGEKIATSQHPNIDVRHLGSAVMVSAVSGLDGQSLFYQLLQAVEEEGSQVINAGFAASDDKIFHTIHSQIKDSESDEYDHMKLSKRLKKLVDDMR